MGFSRQEYWSGLPFPSPGVLPDPGIKPRSPALQADALTSEPPGKSTHTHTHETHTGLLREANKMAPACFLSPLLKHTGAVLAGSSAQSQKRPSLPGGSYLRWIGFPGVSASQAGSEARKAPRLQLPWIQVPTVGEGKGQSYFSASPWPGLTAALDSSRNASFISVPLTQRCLGNLLGKKHNRSSGSLHRPPLLPLPCIRPSKGGNQGAGRCVGLARQSV